MLKKWLGQWGGGPEPAPDPHHLPPELREKLRKVLELSSAKLLNEALRLSDEAVAEYPLSEKSGGIRGDLLEDMGRWGDALQWYERMLKLNPQSEIGWRGKAYAHQVLNELEASKAAYQQLLRINPQDAQMWTNLGVVNERLLKSKESFAAYSQALRLNAMLPQVENTLAYLKLREGEFREGWALHEARLKDGIHANLPLAGQRWRGQTLHGKTLFIYAEQGLGDTLQFARYLHWFKDKSCRLQVCVQPALEAFLKARLDWVSDWIKPDDLPKNSDYHCPLMSLPHVLGFEFDFPPGRSVYLAADERYLDQWRAKVSLLSKRGGDSSDARLRIGVVRKGDPNHKNDNRRSIPAETFLQMFAGLPVELFSLQVQPFLQAPPSPHLPWVHDLSSEILSFEDTAALIEQMDGVVTVDTSVAHLAAAMGKSTWVLITHLPDWRWLLDRTDSPWYPGVVSLFRQTAEDHWGETVQAVRQALVHRIT